MDNLRADELCFNDTGKLDNAHPADVKENSNKCKAREHHEHDPTGRLAIGEAVDCGLDVLLLAGGGVNGRGRRGDQVDRSVGRGRAKAGSITVEIVFAGQRQIVLANALLGKHRRE